MKEQKARIVLGNGRHLPKLVHKHMHICTCVCTLMSQAFFHIIVIENKEDKLHDSVKTIQTIPSVYHLEIEINIIIDTYKFNLMTFLMYTHIKKR